MFFSLVPFFLLIKCRKYLKLNEEDQKHNFLRTLTAEESPSIYGLFFLFLTRMDIIVFFCVFMSGVNKVDFYHMFLMVFFVTFTVFPNFMKRYFIVLIVYVNFFVFEKYVYTLIHHFLDPNSLFVQIADVMGFSTEYLESRSKPQ